MARILVADDDADIRRLLRAILEARGHEVVLASNGRETLEALQQAIPDFVLLDRNMPEVDGVEVLRRIRGRVETTWLPVILLTAVGEETAVVEGFDAGADDYVTKPFNHRALVARIEAGLARSGGRRTVTLQRLVAVFAPRGGAGKTTVAVNLALALAGIAERQIALIDGDLQFGDAGLLLNIATDRSLLDLLAIGEPLDASAIEQVLVRHPSGLRVLARPSPPEEVERLPLALVREVVDTIRRMGDVTVVDTHTSYDDKTLALLDRADLIVTVITPELGALHNLREFLALADAMNYARQRIILVLNRATLKAGLTPAQVREAAGLPLAAEIPDGGPDVLARANMGTPLLTSAPRSDVTRAIAALAQQVATRLQA